MAGLRGNREGLGEAAAATTPCTLKLVVVSMRQ